MGLMALRDQLAEVGYEYEALIASEKKTQIGMYYTPISVVSEVVKNALAPFLIQDDGSTRKLTLADILRLRICDPALGAGVFLLECCFQLTEFLAQQGEKEPTIPKQIAQHCLFGVDIDSSAVLIARQVLKDFCIGYLSKNKFGNEAEDEPTNYDFLEKNILCADSLKLWGTATLQSDAQFDIVLGNPPFLGGRKIRRVLGDDYFHYLTQEFTVGESGNADLCVYFLRLAERLLAPGGVCGMVATNTVAEGDSRRVGLDVLLSHGARIYHVASFPWSGNATVYVTTVHWQNALVPKLPHKVSVSPKLPNLRLKTSHPCPCLNGKQVAWIPASLKHLDTQITAQHFPENETLCYQGCVLAAKGFILTPKEALNLWSSDERYRDVVVPYYTGDDVISTPNTMEIFPRRYVISFWDWTLERVMDEYPLAFNIVHERVFPARQNARRIAHRKRWWQFGDKRPALMRTIRERKLSRFLLQTRHAKYIVPTWVSTNAIYSESSILFPTDSLELQAVLSSGVHETWVRETSSSLGNELRYSPTDCFFTFPLPNMKFASMSYFKLRYELCQKRKCGLTVLMNQFHDVKNDDMEMQRLRELYLENEVQVFRSYGWTDLTPRMDFHDTPRGKRFELCIDMQEEVLQRLTQVPNYRWLYS